MSISPILELGEEIERRWGGKDHDLRCFPDLCADQLRSARLSERIGVDDLVRWALRSELPAQCDPKGKFGQPPLTLFRGEHFHIDALFWVDGITTIHDHGFSGAFQLLSGSSIETGFDFAVSREVDSHLRLGELSVLRTALLSPGDVRSISAGPRYIHSLFHLHRPSVSLVVRTFWDPAPGVQLRYYPAGLAHDASFEEGARDRRIQIVEMLRQIDDASLDDHLGELFEQSDLHTVFAAVRISARLRDSRRQEALLGRIRDGVLAGIFGDWLSEERRLGLLRNARAHVHDPATRFLLAVLLNTHRRADALALVASYAPDADPARQVAAWLKGLANTTMRLQVGNTPFEPSVLGLPPFGPGCEEGLAELLTGRQGAWTGEVRAFLDRLRALPHLRPLFVDGDAPKASGA